jgi:cell division septum initiation protein DivIVA
MDIQHLLGRLEAVLLESRKVPGTKMKLVDTERCFQLIDQMVLAIPEEIKKAQRIQAEHDRILAQAKEESERIKEMARDEAAQLADDTTIYQMAQQRATATEDRVRRETDRMRNEADAYAIDTLQRLKEELDHTMAVVNNGLGKLEQDRSVRLGVNAQPEGGSQPQDAAATTS